MGCAPSYLALWMGENNLAMRGKRIAVDMETIKKRAAVTESMIANIESEIKFYEKLMKQAKETGRLAYASGDMDRAKSEFNSYRVASSNKKLLYTLKDTLNVNNMKMHVRATGVDVMKFMRDMSEIVADQTKVDAFDEAMTDLIEKINDGAIVDVALKEHSKSVNILNDKGSDNEDDGGDVLFGKEFNDFLLDELPSVPNVQLLPEVKEKNRRPIKTAYTEDAKLLVG